MSSNASDVYVGQAAKRARQDITHMVDDFQGNIGIVEGTGELGSTQPAFARLNPLGLEAEMSARNTLLSLMDSQRGQFAMIVVDTSERMDAFLASDPGFDRRFERISLPKPPVEAPLGFLIGPGG